MLIMSYERKEKREKERERRGKRSTWSSRYKTRERERESGSFLSSLGFLALLFIVHTYMYIR